MMLTKAGDKASSTRYELPSSTPTIFSVEEKGNIITESSSFIIIINEPLAQAFSTEKQKYKEKATKVESEEDKDIKLVKPIIKGAQDALEDRPNTSSKEKIAHTSEGEMDELKGKIEPGQQKQSIAHFQIDLQSLYKGVNDAGDEIVSLSFSSKLLDKDSPILLMPQILSSTNVIISKKLR